MIFGVVMKKRCAGLKSFLRICRSRATVLSIAMSLQTLLEDSHIIISYDHLGEWLVADWRGDQNMATVQRGGADILRRLPHPPG